MGEGGGHEMNSSKESFFSSGPDLIKKHSSQEAKFKAYDDVLAYSGVQLCVSSLWQSPRAKDKIHKETVSLVLFGRRVESVIATC